MLIAYMIHVTRLIVETPLGFGILMPFVCNILILHTSIFPVFEQSLVYMHHIEKNNVAFFITYAVIKKVMLQIFILTAPQSMINHTYICYSVIIQLQLYLAGKAVLVLNSIAKSSTPSIDMDCTGKFLWLETDDSFTFYHIDIFTCKILMTINVSFSYNLWYLSQFRNILPTVQIPEQFLQIILILVNMFY